MSTLRAHGLALLLAALTAGGAAGAEPDKITDIGDGRWILSFRLPDSYMPKGFFTDPKDGHFIFQVVDPGCEAAHCRRYFIGPNAHCANYSLSAKPGEPTSPVGYARPGAFTPRTIGNLAGYFHQGFVSQDAFQSTFVFKIGSCVMGLYIDADAASPRRGPRQPRPSEAEVLQTYQQFAEGYRRYIAERGWMNLEGARRKPDLTAKTTPAETPRDEQTTPPEAAPPEAVPPEGETTTGDLTPAEIAAISGLAGGTALLGSLMLLGASGVGREEAIAALRELLRGRAAEDPFEAWKRKYEALGWRYSETNGVATFDPVEGARNEAGEVYSSARGGFVRPEGEMPMAPPAAPRDGDVNARGEVWSSFSGGYVDRRTYDADQASRAWLADKAERDRVDMQRPDADIAELQRTIAATRREGAALTAFFDARRELGDALHQQRLRELMEGPMEAGRGELFDDLERRLDAMGTRRDFREGLKEMLPLADVIGGQMREGFQPTYSYRDAVFDTALQTGALALDAVATRGAASSSVGSALAMRDAARAGAEAGDVLAAGAKAAVVDFLFGKAAGVAGDLGKKAWAAYGDDALRAVRTAVTGTADDAARALGGDLAEHMRRNLDTLDQGVHLDGSGRPRASLSDVLDVQQNPHQVRALKQAGAPTTQEAFNNTLRHEVYKPHDQMLIERLRQSSPELADKKLMVHEFRTPGKAANPINTDRDFRVLMQDADGKWIEVPKAKWEAHSNDAFAELTFFDPAKCPKDMTPAQQKAWWAERHGHTPTDRAFREASRDYSDQAVDLASGRRTQLDQPRIADLKDIAAGKAPVPQQPVRLADPQALAQQFHEKVAGNLRRGDPFEAIAQAQKGVDTLDTVRKAYGAQGIPSGNLPGNLRQAMDLVKASDLPGRPDAAALARLNGDLGRLGFAGLDDFSHKLSSQFEALKWAQ